MKKNILKTSIVFGLVIILTGMPSIFTQQAAGILGTRSFQGGTFAGSAELNGDNIICSLNANARSLVVCCPLGTNSIRAIIEYSIPAGDLGDHSVVCNMHANLGGSLGDESKGISENLPNFGTFSSGTYSLSNVVENVGLSLTGEVLVDGNEETSAASAGTVTVVKTIGNFLEKLLEWLGFDVCFLEGTRILMADGTYKNIEDIEIGDRVMSYDINDEVITSSTVTEIFAHDASEMMDYYVVINDEIYVTPNHLLYINNVLTPADCAEIGDIFRKVDGTKVLIYSVERVYEQVTTYNFYIDGNGTCMYIADDIPAYPLKVNAIAGYSNPSAASVYIESITHQELLGSDP